MTDLGRRIEEARQHVKPRWSPERARRVRLAIENRASRAARWQTAYRVLALAVILVGIGLGGLALLDDGETPAIPVASDILLRLKDGSVVTSLSANARIETEEASATLTALRLREGAARFTVTPQDGRVFRVHARDAVVEVVGTRFVVAIEPTGTRVTVEQGRVKVTSSSGEQLLSAGQSTFAPIAPEPKPAEPASGPAELLPPEEPDPQLNPRPVLPSSPSWKALAESGDYAAALRHIKSSGGPEAASPGDLLLAADVARLGGEPEQALPWLETVVRKHASDSRAPLAAFTLGRTLLDQLGRPREAAQAFAAARRLAPGGALAEDALAREVESWSRAGEASIAQARAAEYLQLYPEGRRRRAVMRYSGEN